MLQQQLNKSLATRNNGWSPQLSRTKPRSKQSLTVRLPHIKRLKTSSTHSTLPKATRKMWRLKHYTFRLQIRCSISSTLIMRWRGQWRSKLVWGNQAKCRRWAFGNYRCSRRRLKNISQIFIKFSKRNNQAIKMIKSHMRLCLSKTIFHMYLLLNHKHLTYMLSTTNNQTTNQEITKIIFHNFILHNSTTGRMSYRRPVFKILNLTLIKCLQSVMHQIQLNSYRYINSLPILIKIIR